MKKIKFFIRVKNFGSINENEFEIKPITIIHGGNGTGKTYSAKLIFTGIELIKQLKFYFPKNSTFFSQLPSESEFEISNFQEFIHEYFSPAPGLFKNLLEKVFSCPPQELITFGKEQAEVSYRVISNDIDFEISFLILQNGRIKIELKINSVPSTIKVKATTENVVINNVIIPNYRPTKNSALRVKTAFIFFFETLLPDTAYFPHTRSSLSMFFSQFTNKSLKGNDLPFISQSLLSMLMKASSKTEKNENEVIELLEKEVLKSEIDFKDVEGLFQMPEITVKENGNEIKLVRASAMHSELASIILYLKYEYHPNTMFFIDEPEAHLHPKAQDGIAKAIQMLARKGNYIVITTHSEYLISQIKELSSDVTIYELK